MSAGAPGIPALGPVLVSGASGYLGGALVRRLVDAGAETYALVRRTDRTAALEALGARVHRVPEGTSALVDLVGTLRPRTCVHLAARFQATHAPVDVDPLIDANFSFGVRLGEALDRADAAVLVTAGTFWQCQNGDTYRPVSLYAALKQSQEDALEHFARNGSLRIANLRFFDVYGPDDPRGKLVSILMSSTRAGAIPIDLSPGEQRIDLLHVDDAVDALLAAAHAAAAQPLGSPSLRFAASGGSPMTLRELVATVERVAGCPVAVRWGVRPYRAVEMFEHWNAGPPPPAWHPRVALDEGLRRLVAAT